MKFIERLGTEWLFFDGGIGTILQEHGLAAGGTARNMEYHPPG